MAAMIDDAEKLCTKYAKTFVPAMQATPREKEYSKHLVELCQGVVLSLNASLKFASQGALVWASGAPATAACTHH